MAMTWGSLTAAKGISGSLQNYVAYSKLDVPPIVDEAQSLLFETLRTREMMTSFMFRVPTGNSEVALPTGFLDPIGKIVIPTTNDYISHTDESAVQKQRTYTNSTGTLGTNPLTTVSGSSLVTVNLSGHGFNQGGAFTVAAATAVGGLPANGTFPIVSIIDANDFVVDMTTIGQATSSASGGGSACTYSCDNLIQGPPQEWAIWDEAIKFVSAFNTDCTGQLLYYRAPTLLSATNQSNFLTNRYPTLLRKACLVMAADFMKDDGEYQKGLTALTGLIQQTNVENEGFRRGSEIWTETP